MTNSAGALHLWSEDNRPGRSGQYRAAQIGDAGLPAESQARSKRSAFMTFAHAATKSRTNFSLLSSCA